MPNGNLDVQIAFIAVKIFKPFDIFLVFIRQQTTIIHDPWNRVVPSAALPDFNVFAKLLVSEAQFRVIRWLEIQFTTLHPELLSFADNIPHRAAHTLALYLDGVIALLAVLLLNHFLIGVHSGGIELLPSDHLKLFQEFTLLDREIFRIHQICQSRIPNRVLRAQLSTE